VRKLIAPDVRPYRCFGVAACRKAAVFTSKSITAIPPTISAAARMPRMTQRGSPEVASG